MSENTKEDGGQAFPFVTDDDLKEHLTIEWGMSLRDYFAVHASEEDVIAMIANVTAKYGPPLKCDTAHNRVRARWLLADIMLKEREK